MSGINTYTPNQSSPFDRIGKALDAVASIYGIQHAATQADMLRQQAENQAVLNDAGSDPSNAARATLGAIVDQAVKRKVLAAPGASNPDGSISENDHTGALLNAIKGMSAAQVQDYDKSSGLSDLVKEQLAQEQNDRVVKVLQAGMGNKQELLQERMDNMAHQKVLAKLKSDPTLGKRLSQYQNLQNTLSNFQNADVSNPQAIDELQQGIRQNLGIGGGGVGEREHTYINSLGLNADRFQQFLTGDPVALSKDTPLAAHLKQLVGLESQNIANQMGSKIKFLTSGNEGMYKRNPEYATDLQNAISAAQGQFADQPVGNNPGNSGGIIGVTGANAAQNDTKFNHIKVSDIDAEIAKRAAAKKKK